MTFARAAVTVFGLGTLALGGTAVADIVVHGTLTLFSPLLLGAVALLGLATLFMGLLDARVKTRDLQARSTELRTLAAQLEYSLATVSAINARLNESEMRYKGLVDAQGDAIFRRAPDSRLTYGNDAFFRLFGLHPSLATGRPFAPELHPDSRAPVFGSFTGLKSARPGVRYDQHVRTAYGWRWIAWEDYPVRDARGTLIEIQSVGRDVSERKALEDALTEARDKAEAASRAKSGFLATMSHEIRTPMNGVLGMARLLLETRLLPEQKSYAEAIAQSGEALLTLIEDILDFSKIESGKLTLEDDEVDLRKTVDGVVELLASKAHAKGVEIVSLVAADVPVIVRGDGMRLRQVLTNLIGNAVKFTERGGVRVEVSLERRERRLLRFEVRDTGVGVPAHKREEIFDEFVQADSSHARRFGGSGLGLAISRRLVEAMGGKIGVDACEAGGSAFWFNLPAMVVRDCATGGDAPLAGTNIAIVARNQVLREGLTDLIARAGGQVVPLGRSESGSRTAAVLIDGGTASEIDLPARPDGRARAIVLLTPAARGQLAEMRELGFSGYLVKPVRQASLIEQLLTGPMADSAMDEPLPDTASVAHPAIAPVLAAAAAGGLKILLAEDNPINAMLTRELLKRRGHRVSEVASGEAAVKACAMERFDLVLTDIHMPGLDGVEATRLIRADEAAKGRARVPIVALTADALETGKRACQEAGMDGFLTKPIDPAELSAVLNELFPGSESEAFTEAAA